MTRIIYENTKIILETNGDCSTMTLNFLEEDIPLCKRLRNNFIEQGFFIQEEYVGDNQIRFVCLIQE